AGGVAGSGGAGTGGSSGMGGGGTGGTPPMGACDNTSDLAALTSLPATNARQIAASCGLAPSPCAALISFENEFKDCVDLCVEQAVTGLSTECASCYGDLAWCSRILCLAPCASNACETGCYQTCPGYPGCLDALSQCAGRDSTDCRGDT
ncbi:MAG: hypothetical protein WBN01_13630, partial [Polyangiales bacterium]